jgi:hypothetical protein
MSTRFGLSTLLLARLIAAPAGVADLLAIVGTTGKLLAAFSSARNGILKARNVLDPFLTAETCLLHKVGTIRAFNFIRMARMRNLRVTTICISSARKFALRRRCTASNRRW